MARLGVTYQDIANAANQLIGQGRQPTIELIRQFLGTGSSTTIANHLRKWRADQDGSSSLARAENLPAEIITLMKGLWERLCYDAQEKISINDTKYQQTIAELQQELQKYKTNNQRWQQLFNQWTREKEQMLADKLTVDQGIEALQKEKIGLQSKIESQINQLQEKQERVDELNRLHRQTQTNLEHYRESVREERLLEQQQFAQQKQELQSEVKMHKDQLAMQREKTANLQQQYQGLQQTHKILEEHHAQVKSQLEKIEKQLTEVEKVKNEHQQASLHWQNQYKEVQKNLENKNTQFIDTKAEIKVLSQQLSDAKQALSERLDQNKLLGHEKWLLAQEKAQLEGQLQQMQKMVSA